MCRGFPRARLRGRSLASLTATIAGAFLAASSAQATENGYVDETRRWVPSIGLAWGLFFQDSRAAVVTDFVTNSSPPERLREPAAGSEKIFSPFLGGSFELMTPRLIEPVGRPRIFARVDVTAAFGFTYDVAREGTVGPMVHPPGPFPEREILGQGSVTRVEVDPFVVTAGAGFAFTIDHGERRFRIKPSVEYLRETLKITGIVNRAIGLDGGGQIDPSTFRLIYLGNRTTRIYDAVGPGLEVEIDAARFAPFTMTAFLGAQAYAVLDNETVLMRSQASDVFGTETAVWAFRKDDWIYRVGMGVRFRWLPDSD